jgi:hypothetical protein
MGYRSLSISPRGRRLHDERVARLHIGGVRPLQTLHPPVVPSHPVLTDLAGLAAGETERAHAAVAGQNRAFR